MTQTTILRPRASVGPTIREADGSLFTFDALLSESPSDEGALTKHPVENGADVSDHYRNEPVKLSLVCGVTNSPLSAQGAPQQNRDIAMYDDLRAIKARGEPVTVVTGLRVYRDMVIVRVSTTRDSRSGQALALNVELEQVILTTTETVDIPADLKRRKAGRQNPEAVKEAESATAQLDAAVATASAIDGARADSEAIAADRKQTADTAGSYHGG